MKKNKFSNIDIAIVAPCFNESENIINFYDVVVSVMKNYKYSYTIIFIDNASTDDTVSKIKKIISKDKKVRLIVNSRNFGHIRSPFYGLIQSGFAKASILLASDLQDPPKVLLPKFISQWEKGYKTVIARKISSDENKLMFILRSLFYKFLRKISSSELFDNFTGAGLYDKDVIKYLEQSNIKYPYFRGLISEIGLKIKVVEFNQPIRQKGVTKNNFFTLYDMAMLGVISHSKLPLRLISFIGFILSGISIVMAVTYLTLKILNWDSFDIGIAPIILGVLLLGGIQLFSIGIIGEYVMDIKSNSNNLPIVIEKERINFDKN